MIIELVRLLLARRVLFWVGLVGFSIVLWPVLAVPMGLSDGFISDVNGVAVSGSERADLVIQLIGTMHSSILGIIGLVVGATAGSQGVSAGMMREYVATGRPRAIVAVAEAISAVIVVVAAVVAGVVVYSVAAAAASRGMPEFETVLRSGAVAVFSATISAIMGTCLTMLLPSRGIVIAAWFGVIYVAAPVVTIASTEIARLRKILGWWDDVWFKIAFDEVRIALQPSNFDVAQILEDVGRSVWVSLLVVAVWVIAAFAAGIFRRQQREV